MVDFFCGCGGTSAGLEKSGMKILAGIDVDKNALSTFSTNFPEAEPISKSIVELNPEELATVIKNRKKNKLVFSACAPCQPFSTQNRLKSDSDERLSLLAEFHRFVEYWLPDYLLLENVPGIQKAEKGPFTEFLKFIEDQGYQYTFAVKNAVNYGVPQSRRRLVLIASLHGEPELPEETHGPKKLPYVTVREAISKYPKLVAGSKSNKIINHECASLKSITLERLQATPEGGSRHDWPEHLILECHKKHNGHGDVYGRLSWDKPSVTLTTKCVSISNGRFGHPEQDRAISVREAAALQSFDDNFIFKGTFREAAKQVGNAVPVLFAKALGDQIKRLHNQKVSFNG